MLWLLLDYGINLLLALAAVLGFWGIGRLLWLALLRGYTEDSLAAVFQFAIGAWATWTTVFLLGLLGLYRPWAADSLLCLSAAAGCIQLFQQRARLLNWFKQPRDRTLY